MCVSEEAMGLLSCVPIIRMTWLFAVTQ